MQAHGKFQLGYVLINVIFTLFIVAAIALLLNMRAGEDANSTHNDHLNARLDYIANAGIAHTIRNATNAGCSGYPDVAATTFYDGYQYSTSISPTAGSPVSITAKVSHDTRSESYSLTKPLVPIWRAPTNVTLQMSSTSGDDSYIDSVAVISNFGNDASLALSDNPLLQKRILLKFDLSSIPDNVSIREASLTLYQNAKVLVGGDAEITAHAATQNWLENQATWLEYSSSNSWTTAGGDYRNTPMDLTELDQDNNEWREWDVDWYVQAVKSGAISNYGILLIGNNNVDVAFASRHHSNQSLAPTLQISYTCTCAQTC